MDFLALWFRQAFISTLLVPLCDNGRMVHLNEPATSKEKLKGNSVDIGLSAVERNRFIWDNMPRHSLLKMWLVSAVNERGVVWKKLVMLPNLFTLI